MYQRQVTFAEAIKMALTQNYCNFNGRSSRSEYWWFCLFSFIIGIAVNLIFGDGYVGQCASGLVSLAFLLPSLGLMVRRLHDIGKSGWFILFSLLPLIGWILIIIWTCRDSQQGDNEYGPEPNMVY